MITRGPMILVAFAALALAHAGRGSAEGSADDVPVVRALAAGEKHTCAMTDQGAWCWGGNHGIYSGHGVLGTDDKDDRASPAEVVGLGPGLRSIAAGKQFTCVVTAEGEVLCWGDNTWGQLGDGTKKDRLKPVAVVGVPSPAVQVAAGYQEACALLADGHVACWGHGEAPALVKDLPLASAIALFNGKGCALTRQGRVRCWFMHEPRQKGSGIGWVDPVKKYRGDGVTKAISIAAGDRHACAVLKDGSVRCWGDNYSGQLGDGTKRERGGPVKVVGIKGSARAVFAGGRGTCVVTAEKQAFCWGQYKERAEPADLSDVASVAIGGSHTCAVTHAGRVVCWGQNDRGQLGSSTTAEKSIEIRCWQGKCRDAERMALRTAQEEQKKREEKSFADSQKYQKTMEAMEQWDRRQCKGVSVGARVIATVPGTIRSETWIIDRVGSGSVTVHAEKDRHDTRTFDCADLKRAF